MLRTNNRCVDLLNISVMSPNVENIHKFTQYTDYLSIHGKVSTPESNMHVYDVDIATAKLTKHVSHDSLHLHENKMAS